MITSLFKRNKASLFISLGTNNTPVWFLKRVFLVKKHFQMEAFVGMWCSKQAVFGHKKCKTNQAFITHIIVE